jgi:hypothetical protein
VIPTPEARLRDELAELRQQIGAAVVGPPVWPRLLAATFGGLLGALLGLCAFFAQIQWD